jgi:hypothetical protein
MIFKESKISMFYGIYMDFIQFRQYLWPNSEIHTFKQVRKITSFICSKADKKLLGK